MLKNILLSLGVSTALLLLCLVVGIVAVLATSGGQKQFNVETARMVDLPFRPLKALMYAISPPTAEDYKQTITGRKLIMVVLVYGGSIIAYAIPIFVIVQVASRMRKRKDPPHMIDVPPPPPKPVNQDS